MNSPRNNFNDIAATKAKKKREAPFSLRLSFEERAALQKLAKGKPLGGVIRAILREAIASDKGVPTAPAVDTESLGRVLGQLGKSRLSQNMNQLAKATNMGALPVTPETENEIRQACADIAAMRAELMRALQNGGSS